MHLPIKSKDAFEVGNDSLWGYPLKRVSTLSQIYPRTISASCCLDA